MKVLLNGAKGRMGQTLLRLAPEHSVDFSPCLDAGDALPSALDGIVGVIDFSHHTATAPLAALCGESGVPLLIGTTGHNPAERAQIEKAAERCAVLWSGNYSVGVNLLFWLTRRAAEILDASYDAEVLEMHHRHKKDAPSGTAENLVEAIREARSLAAGVVRHGREGITGERPRDEIGVHAVRGGEIVGEHTVYFISPQDRIELTHRASDRAIFAAGALRGIRWLAGKAPGVYRMEDVLGLSGRE
ncbi:MAG: 4-hydroxy-tetrahydrodipicolinate reductase [Opitutales bacterium]|nr:4-hydroxy-tetrahydrodipicolinate reductase [Opitutales bacterium]